MITSTTTEASGDGGRGRRGSLMVSPASRNLIGSSRTSASGTHFTGSRYGTPSLSKDAEEKCTEAFSLLDVDQSGRIDATELGRGFQLLEIELPKMAQNKIIRAMLTYLDKDMDSEISLSEFKQLWGAYIGWKKRKKKEQPRPPMLPPVSGPGKLPLSLFLIVDDPSSCIVGKLVSILIILTIMLSTTTFVLETDPAFRKWESGRVGLGVEVSPPAFEAIEVFSIVLFSLEYLIRICLVGFAPPNDESTYRKVFSFFVHPMNLIDLLAILPYYVELVAASRSSSDTSGGGADAFSVLRILRVARVFRVFKLGKYSSGLQMFARVLLDSVSALMLLMFFLLIAVILFGSLVYYAEKGEWNSELGGFARMDVTGQKLELTPFTSIPASFWWVLTTSTTVGYGDMYPTSLFGKLVGLITMLMGILALALPVTIIGSNFSRVHADIRDQHIAADQRGLIDMWLTLTEEKNHPDENKVESMAGKKYAVVSINDTSTQRKSLTGESSKDQPSQKSESEGEITSDGALKMLAAEVAEMKKRFTRIEQLLGQVKK